MSVLSPKSIATIARVSVRIYKLIRKLYDINKVASLAWWVYVIVLLSLFFGGLLLNYIVKRINEARLESRFSNLRNKISNDRSTQIQRSLENGQPIPAGNIDNNMISLVFNKEENVIEDKKRKEVQSRNSADCVVIIDPPEDIPSANSFHSTRDDDINRTIFLGNIYKELYEKRTVIDKTKSLSSTDRDSILNEIVDKMVSKMNESKSTPSIKKLIEMQNEDDLRDWALDLVRKKSVPKADKKIEDLVEASTSIVNNK